MRFMFPPLTPVVKNLIIINVLCFFAIYAIGANLNIDIRDILGLHLPQAPDFRPFQFVTYLFMHGDFGHLFFNMLTLYFLGSWLETTLGPKRFLTFFLFTGIGATALYLLTLEFEIWPGLQRFNYFLSDPTTENAFIVYDYISAHVPLLPDIFPTAQAFEKGIYSLKANSEQTIISPQTIRQVSELKAYYLNLPSAIGASGAVFGVLFGVGYLFPNREIILFPIPIPIKIKYVVIGLAVMELYLGLQNSASDNVAHYAHLGGMLFAYFLFRYWKIPSGH